MDNKNREKIIVKTSVVGIITNVVLSAFKAVVGLLSHSIALTIDAVNNLTDALSSVVTIIGAKLAAKAPDKQHPLGHGRVEYISQTVVAVIILYAGITALIESIKKIISPVEASYGTMTLVVMVVAVIVKLILGTYVKKQGRAAHSGTLIASGEDAMFDAVITTSVLVSAIIYLIFNVSIEAYVGVVISVMIIKSGIEIIRDAVNQMLGERVGCELTNAVKQTVREMPGVKGAYDLVLHNYGPDRYMGSIHVEVDENMKARDIDLLTRRTQAQVYQKTGVVLTTVGIYSANTSDETVSRMRQEVTDIVMGHTHLMQIHGFFVDTEQKRMQFDMIIDFAEKDRQALYQHILQDIKERFPDYDVHITLDLDVSE